MTSSILAQLSYDAALRALDLQERTVEQLRARTGILLAASSLTTSFLGAQTIQHAHGIGALALASLCGSIGLSLYVLIPKRGLTFGLGGRETYESLIEVADEEEVHRRLAYWLTALRTENQAEIDGLDRLYVGAALALMLQLVLWSIALIGTLG
jgi:hypothetical protein